jgi:hypothetical protein
MFDPPSSVRLGQFDLSPEPDLHPLYPTPAYISPLLSPHSGLSPPQKAELVAHCLTRACVFGDHSVVSYLLGDSQAQPYVDLGIRDEDGLGLISLAIHGFGAESDHDVEREECVRLLIAQGADISADKGTRLSFSPLHSFGSDHTPVSWVDTTSSRRSSFASDPDLSSHDPRVLTGRRDTPKFNGSRCRYSSVSLTRTRRHCSVIRRVYAKRGVDRRKNGGKAEIDRRAC